MERRQLLEAAGIVATGGLVGLAGCSESNDGDGGEDGTTPEPSDSDGSAAGDHTVAMVSDGSDYYYDPIGLFVESGETVTFEIQSGRHSATAYVEGTSGAAVTRIPEGADGFDSETINEQGGTYDHTFDEPGTYDYFCIPHKSLEMVGRIVVDEPGGPAEGSDPPDGPVPDSETIVDDGTVSYSDFTG